MSEVKPALSPKGWADVLHRDDDEVVPTSTHEYEMAAVYLYYHPNGFTWEDVDALAKCDADTQVTDDPSGVFDRLVSIRHRIAALLPPRENEK